MMSCKLRPYTIVPRLAIGDITMMPQPVTDIVLDDLARIPVGRFSHASTKRGICVLNHARAEGSR